MAGSFGKANKSIDRLLRDAVFAFLIPLEAASTSAPDPISTAEFILLLRYDEVGRKDFFFRVSRELFSPSNRLKIIHFA